MKTEATDFKYLPLFLTLASLVFFLLGCGQKEEKVEVTPQPAAPQAQEPAKPVDIADRCLVIATSGVNVREKPNINAKVIEKLPLGSSAEIVAIEGDWYQVKLVGNKTGWAAAKYDKDILLAETGKLQRNEQNYFPLNVGAEWSFSSTDNTPLEKWRLGNGQNGEILLAIHSFYPTVSNQFFILNTEEDGSITANILNPYNNPTNFKPKLLLLGFDPRANHVQAARCKASSSSTDKANPTISSYETTVLITQPPESIKTSSGEYMNCYKLERRTITEKEINRSEVRETLWFAAGVGPVRIDRSNGSLLLSAMTVNPAGFLYPRDEALP